MRALLGGVRTLSLFGVWNTMLGGVLCSILADPAVTSEPTSPHWPPTFYTHHAFSPTELFTALHLWNFTNQMRKVTTGRDLRFVLHYFQEGLNPGIKAIPLSSSSSSSTPHSRRVLQSNSHTMRQTVYFHSSTGRQAEVYSTQLNSTLLWHICSWTAEQLDC